jgi:plastocyanin
VVNDKSSIHNFHLKGPGFDKATSVPGVGKTTWNVPLRVGTYTYVCDPHASTMKGSFGVHP